MMSDGITDMERKREHDERQLKKLNEEQTHIIRNYCNAIGCRDCPLNRKPDQCRSMELQDKILELEFKWL
jgi:hypothetical protein